MKLILRLIFIISIISLGTACEEEDGLSSKVDIRINGKPRVFTNKKKIPSLVADATEYIEIAPPFFSFRLSIRNGSDKTLVVTGIQLEIFTQESTHGSPPSGTNDFPPSDCPYTKDYNPCELFDQNTYTVLLPKSDRATLQRTFYAEGLPDNGNSFVYKVNLELLGFFSEETDPLQAVQIESDRFKRVVRFTTE